MNKRKIAENFSLACATYEKESYVQKLAGEKLTLALKKKEETRPAVILEIGSGTGDFTRLLAGHFPESRIIASDIAPGMIKNFPSIPRVSLIGMDGEQPALSQESCDIVAGNFVAQWFEDMPTAIERLMELLRPGGSLALSILKDSTFAEWYRLLGYEPHQFPTVEAIKQMCGPRLYSLEEHHHRLTFPHIPAVRLHLKSLGAQTPGASPNPFSFSALRTLYRLPARAIALEYHWVSLVSRKPL